MNDNDLHMTSGGLSMRRTLLTLLGGFAAFAVLTASYATAELPEANIAPVAIVGVVQ